MLLKTFLSIVYAASVTYAAVYFNRPSILWWYVLLIFLSAQVKVEG